MEAHFVADRLDFDELYILSGMLQLPTSESHRFIEDLSKLWGWLQEPSRSLSQCLLPDWQREYLRLFVAKMPGTRGAPYESSYCDGAEPGACALRVSDLCVQAGIKLGNMPPDFLGAELLLLAQLLEQPEERGARDLAGELWARMSEWVPRYAADLREDAKLPIYSALATRLERLFD
jgi:TorA maturation chaperone TorD